jgi:hypothetical protein
MDATRVERGAGIASHGEDHEESSARTVAPRRLWFGLFGAPAAWSIHAVAATAINGYGCITWPGEQPPSGRQLGSVVGVALILVSLVLLLTALAALLTSFLNWSEAHSHAAGEEAELLEGGEGRIRFMAMAGILLGMIFSLLIAFNTVAVFAAPQCTF